jgi:MFS family permease
LIRLALAIGLGMAGFHAWIATIPVAMHTAGRPDGEIGTVVGSAAVFNLVASLGVGGLLDRYGGRALYLVGCSLLVAAAIPIGLGVVNASSPFGVWIAIRLLQGVGLAAVFPAVQSLVPDRVPARSVATGLASVGIAGNLSLALAPPISLVLLEHIGLAAVGVAVVIVVGAGAVQLWFDRHPRRIVEPAESRLRGLARAFRPAWRPEWAAPLACTFLFVAHWGVVTGYLAQRAEPVGADVGLFFTGDAIGLLAFRIPAGWAADRVRALPLVLGGIAITCAALCLLLLPPTTLILVISGIGTGAGAALFLPVLMVELSRRSDSSDRGSAFGLYSVAFGAAIAIGSLGPAPVISTVGFEAAMIAGILACAGSALLALVDPLLRRHPRDWLVAGVGDGSR